MGGRGRMLKPRSPFRPGTALAAARVLALGPSRWRCRNVGVSFDAPALQRCQFLAVASSLPGAPQLLSATQLFFGCRQAPTPRHYHSSSFCCRQLLAVMSSLHSPRSTSCANRNNNKTQVNSSNFTVVCQPHLSPPRLFAPPSHRLPRLASLARLPRRPRRSCPCRRSSCCPRRRPHHHSDGDGDGDGYLLHDADPDAYVCRCICRCVTAAH